jgi:hypothetical protein
LTALLFALALSAPPETAPLDALVDQVLERYGGRAALEKASARLDEGTTSSSLHPGQVGRIRRVLDRRGSLRVEVRFPDGEGEVRILHRGRGTRNGADVTGTAPHLAMVLQAARLRLPLLLHEGRSRLVDLGLLEREGKVLRVVELPIGDGMLIQCGIDPVSLRIVRTAGQVPGPGPGLQFATEYDDFRRVNGVLVPFLEANFAPGGRSGDSKLEKVELSREPPAGSFDAAGAQGVPL